MSSPTPSVVSGFDGVHRDALLPLATPEQALSSLRGWERVLSQLIEIGLRGSQVDRASLMLWNHHEQALKITAAINLPQTIVATTREKAGEMIAGWVFHAQHPLWLTDDIPLDQVKQSMRRPEIGSALCIPLHTGDRTIGVLNLSRLRGNAPFSGSDFEMMSRLCHHAAIPIENAYLSERLAAEEQLRLSQARFLSPRVAQMIAVRDSPEEMPRVTRPATVLVADIRGYTHLVEQTATRTLLRVLGDYFDAMTDIIVQHQGVVDEWSGDAILATFDRGVTDDQDAQQAVCAGVDMLAKLKTLQLDWSTRGLPTFNIGIGISTGMMAASCIGSARRMAVVTLGSAINIASRLEKLTKKFKVSLIIAQKTFERVQDLIEYRELGSVVLDGLADAVRLYGVYGLRGDCQYCHSPHIAVK